MSPCGVQDMGAVRGIRRVVTVLPLAGGRAAHPVLLRQSPIAQAQLSHLLPPSGDGPGFFVECDVHGVEPLHCQGLAQCLA